MTAKTERILDVRIVRDRDGLYYVMIEETHRLPLKGTSWSGALRLLEQRIESMEWQLNRPLDPSDPAHIKMLLEGP